MPAGSGTKHPQNPVHELAVVGCSTANMLHSTRKRVLDPLPLTFAQLISDSPHHNCNLLKPPPQSLYVDTA